MRFRILGPLEVETDGHAAALGGAKPRGVLAMLLLHADEPVGAERLALALWGEDAPASAVKTVQVYVARLRKALGGAAVLETTGTAYRLRVEPGELDLERFERLAEDGRAALAAGEPERAAAALREVGVENVTLVVGDGSAGWPEAAPYDAVNVAAAAEGDVPRALVEQLGPGGRLVAPVERGDQHLVLVRRTNGDVETTRLERVRFVPLT